ncbi:MAG: hypothetical protein F6J92_07870 [Symploca sp. SIO1A3]|nr:hypothetical protein [Symploca sp. SIO1A3]
MTSPDLPPNSERATLIDERKLDYLFNKNIKRDPHNSARATQNAQQLQRLGIYDDTEGRAIITNHLQEVVQINNNVVERYINPYGVDVEMRESLLAGKSGKFVKILSSWEVMPDGKRRLLSFKPLGGKK